MAGGFGLGASRAALGSVERFRYPKQVWTPSGGWWPHPRQWKRNTAIIFAATFAMVIPAAIWCENNQRRTPPFGKIPWRPNVLTREEVFALHDARMAAEAERKAAAE